MQSARIKYSNLRYYLVPYFWMRVKGNVGPVTFQNVDMKMKHPKNAKNDCCDLYTKKQRKEEGKLPLKSSLCVSRDPKKNPPLFLVTYFRQPCDENLGVPKFQKFSMISPQFYSIGWDQLWTSKTAVFFFTFVVGVYDFTQNTCPEK